MSGPSLNRSHCLDSFSGWLVKSKGIKGRCQALKEFNAEKRSVKVGLLRLCGTSLIPGGHNPQLLQFQSFKCLRTGMEKKKKTTFQLMHPFPELHKEGIKRTGNHPNMRIKGLTESV